MSGHLPVVTPSLTDKAMVTASTSNPRMNVSTYECEVQQAGGKVVMYAHHGGFVRCAINMNRF